MGKTYEVCEGVAKRLQRVGGGKGGRTNELLMLRPDRRRIIVKRETKGGCGSEDLQLPDMGMT